MSISCTALRSAILTSFFFPRGPCSANCAKFCMDRKKLPCLQNALQHVPIYLQQCPRYSNRKCKKIAVFTYCGPHFCFPWGRPWGNHAKFVWMEREFDAYKLSRCICPSNYSRFWDRAWYWSKIVIFYKPLHSTPPLGGGFPSEYCYAVWHGKTRMACLPDGEKISKISLFVLTQLTNVTDTHTHTHRMTA